VTGLMEALTRAVEGGFGLALAASFLWGVASIVLSPCHLSGIPLLVAFLSRDASAGSARPYRVASLFALGLVVSVALVGAATAALGRIAGDLGNGANWLVALVLAFVGLALLDVVRLDFSSPNLTRFRGGGERAAFLAGLFFGSATGPCTFAFLAPVLGAGFRAGHQGWLPGAGLVAAFGLGQGLTVVAAGGSIGAVQAFLQNRRAQSASLAFRRVLGGAALLAALYYVHKAA